MAVGTIRVVTGGQSVTVNVTRSGGGASNGFLDHGLTSPATFPTTIAADTSFYFNAPDSLVVSAKISGVECAVAGGSTDSVYLDADRVLVVAPALTLGQVAAFDSTQAQLASPAFTGTPTQNGNALLDVPTANGTYLSQQGVVTTKKPGSFSVLAFQNNDSAAPDSATRIYILPRATPSTGVGGDIKIFADDYSANQTDYRDLGVYFSADQNNAIVGGADTGTRLYGVFWINSKVNGTYAGKSPDIGFCMQDGQYVAGRVALATVGGSTPNIQWVFGAGKPVVGTIAAVVAEFQGNVGLNSAADTSFRWTRTDGTTGDNLLAFQRHASGGQIKATLGSTQRLLLTNAGSLVLGNGSSATATNSTDGFLYVNSMAGTPTGTPTSQGAAVPVALDTTGSKLWAYIGGAWKSVTLA